MERNKVAYPEELIRKYRVITLVKEHKMKQGQAAKELNLSVRQIKRLVKKLRESGGSIDSLRHQRNCPP
jgi:DNA-binding transcriptional regulator LsrR (DeoR family)